MGQPGSMSEVGSRVWRVVNGLFSSNSYICATGDGDGCFLVDPGLDPQALEDAMGALGLKPRRILCTHGHFDHAGSAAFFQDKYGAPCHIHGAELKTLKGSNFLLMAFRIPYSMKLPRIEDLAACGPVLGGREFRVHPTPGHTPGSCILQWGSALFTGDTLYSRGVGLSKLPGEDTGKLKASILGLWDQLPAEAMVHPGHGDGATFGSIKTNNEPLLQFLGLSQAPSQEG